MHSNDKPEKIVKLPKSVAISTIKTCSTCKGFGSQGMGYKKEMEGEYRWCAISMFGDYEKKYIETPYFKVTYGNKHSVKGQIMVHKDFSCINYNSKFEVYCAE